MRSKWLSLVMVISGAYASDYVPADMVWSLNNDPSMTFSSVNDAIEKNCQQLKAHPPVINNISTTVISCGQVGNTSSLTKRLNVGYTLRLATPSFQADKQFKSSFTLTHKASCNTPSFNHLYEEPSAAFRYTCWRCLPSERKAKKPQFAKDGRVKWFSSTHCPLEFSEQIVAANDKPTTQLTPAALPTVLGLPFDDNVALQIEKQAQYGWIVALVLRDGQRKYFIGERDQILRPADHQWGSVQRIADRWQWLNSKGSRYWFEESNHDMLQMTSKQLKTGETWEFGWTRLTLAHSETPTNVTRLSWAIDQHDQRYTFFYDDNGEVSRISIDGRGLYSEPTVSLKFLPARFNWAP